MKIDADLISRFERRVTKLYRIKRSAYGHPFTVLDFSACWVWSGQRSENGYGFIWIDGKKVKAHRFAFRLERGRWPDRGRVIAHSCDNRLCVNPRHLRAATHSSNMRDAKKRKRLVAKGGKIPRLATEKREQILKLVKEGHSFTKTARMSATSRKTVAKIAKRG